MKSESTREQPVLAGFIDLTLEVLKRLRVDRPLFPSPQLIGD
jgi:hypothetical protein